MDASSREKLLEALKHSIPKKQIFENAPMSRYTTLRLGGPADVLVQIASVEQLSSAYAAARDAGAEVRVLGNGSNLLIRDGGVRGLVLQLGELFSEVSDPVPLPDGRVALTAQGGSTLQKLCNAAADHALSGLEFASGIPGTVGGAAYMNAGAYGGEMKDVITHVTACLPDGRTVAYSNEEMDFGYRKSKINQQPEPIAITSVTVALTPGDEETVRATMREFSARRREKQPLTLPSCGSTFKRPEGRFAGTLIEECGLKGCRVGGCSVSTLHAGFLVNDQQGSACDYLSLIAQVQKTVYEKTGVRLEPEVRIWGEDVCAKEI